MPKATAKHLATLPAMSIESGYRSAKTPAVTLLREETTYRKKAWSSSAEPHVIGAVIGSSNLAMAPSLALTSCRCQCGASP